VRPARGKVVLVANSRGGYAVRNYVQNGGGAAVVSHAILGGVPNHGVWMSIARVPAGQRIQSGTGPFLQALNAAQERGRRRGHGPVKWLTIRSDNNDKYAQPDGLWIGKQGVPTNVTFEGPELKGATNVVLPRMDHRETVVLAGGLRGHVPVHHRPRAATAEITPEPRVQLAGKVTGLGLSSTDPASGNYGNNLPLPGAQAGGLRGRRRAPASARRRRPLAGHRRRRTLGPARHHPGHPARVRAQRRPAMPRRTSTAARSRVRAPDQHAARTRSRPTTATHPRW
jgi:triacylglycerol lipase